MKYWTGVGTRTPPEHLTETLMKLGQMFSAVGYHLRTGGADGCDTLFETGATIENPDSCTVYIPWGKETGNLVLGTQTAYNIAHMFVPHWDNLKSTHKKLHARNVNEVIGHGEFPVPSDILVCYTHEGAYVGGTATALRCADYYNVPILNIGDFRYRNLTAEELFEEAMRLINA